MGGGTWEPVMTVHTSLYQLRHLVYEEEATHVSDLIHFAHVLFIYRTLAVFISVPFCSALGQSLVSYYVADKYFITLTLSTMQTSLFTSRSDMNVHPQSCLVIYCSPGVNIISLHLQFCTFYLDYCAFVCVLILTEPPSEVLSALLQPCFSLGICPGARINKHRWKRKKKQKKNKTNICPLLCSPLSEWPDH